MKKKILYDIKNVPIGSNSATGYISKILMDNKDLYNRNVVLEIIGITEVSNLKMIKSFIEDLIYLEEKYGVEVNFVNEE